MLPTATSVHSLQLFDRLLGRDYNHLGPKGGAALADGLKGNSTLQVLE